MSFLLWSALATIALGGVVGYALHHWPARGADGSSVLHAERCGGRFDGSSGRITLSTPLVNLLVMPWGLDIRYFRVRLKIPFASVTAVGAERHLFLGAVRVCYRFNDAPEEILLYSVRNASRLADLIRREMAAVRA